MADSVLTAQLVIGSLYETKSLKNALELHSVNIQNFFRTLANNPVIDEEYVRAQQAIGELLVDELISIADDEKVDPNRARNMLEMRKFVASKFKPQKFGDRIDINLTAAPDIQVALAAAKSRVRDVQAIDITQQISHDATGYKPVDALQSGDADQKALDELLK